jgi:hypothetical protein
MYTSARSTSARCLPTGAFLSRVPRPGPTAGQFWPRLTHSLRSLENLRKECEARGFSAARFGSCDGLKLAVSSGMEASLTPASAAQQAATLQPVTRLLLASGVASSALYTAMLAFVPLHWASYSSTAQTVSELSAIDAPTRPLWVLLAMLWTALYIAFGSGVWLASGGRPALRALGLTIVVAGIFGGFWPPMHQREVLAAGGGSLTDTLHIVWTIGNGVLTLIAMALGAAALGKRFRAYSVATLLTLIAAGALTSLDAPRVDANLATPWIGVWERINIGAWLLWVAVLAVVLLRRAGVTGNVPTHEESSR